MMAYQASADDAPRLKDTGEAGLATVPSAVEVTHLHKSYGSVVAVDDVSFSVAEGEILDMYRTFYRSCADVTALVEALGLAGKTVRFMPSGPFDEGLLTRLAEVTRVERDGRYVVTGTGELVNVVVLALHAAGVEPRDARLVWRQHAPGNLGGFLLALVLSVAALFAIGLCIAAVAPTSGAVRGITAVQAIVYPMFGEFPPTLGLLVLAAYALMFGFLAKRSFRWE